jgi:hypothetical protein
MGARWITVRFKVEDANGARTPTVDEALTAAGKTQWDAELNGNPPNSGQYLVGYVTDMGRRGDERDARGGAHVSDAGFKGRRRGVR